MSFSKQIKDELTKHISPARHCQIAELSALYRFLVKVNGNSRDLLSLKCDNEELSRKYFTLIRKTFNIDDDSKENAQEAEKALNSETILFKSCCKRAFLRGAFLAVGSMSDPEKSYHLEYACQENSDAELIQDLLKSFDIEAKVFKRKNTFVVYIKDGSQIVETLSVMEAHVALMDFENMRIIKEMRNTVNRKVNCETANINKTVSAAQKQIDEIKVLMGSAEYKGLPDPLKEIAQIRIEYPEASFTELGELCDPKVGKSGINHRLRKLSEMASRIKGGEL